MKTLTPEEKIDEKFVFNSFEALGVNFSDFDGMEEAMNALLDNPNVIDYGLNTKAQSIVKHAKVRLQVRSPYMEEINIQDKYLGFDFFSYLAMTEQLHKAVSIKEKYDIDFNTIAGTKSVSLFTPCQIMRHCGISLLTLLPHINEKILSPDNVDLVHKSILLNLTDRDFEDLGIEKTKKLIETYNPKTNIPNPILMSTMLAMAVKNNQYKFAEFLIKDIGCETIYKTAPSPKLDNSSIDAMAQNIVKQLSNKGFIGKIEDYSPFWDISSPGMLRLLSTAPDFNINENQYNDNILESKLRKVRRSSSNASDLEEFVFTLHKLGFDFNMSLPVHGTTEPQKYLDEILQNKHPEEYAQIKIILNTIEERTQLNCDLPLSPTPLKTMKI